MSEYHPYRAEFSLSMVKMHWTSEYRRVPAVRCSFLSSEVFGTSSVCFG